MNTEKSVEVLNDVTKTLIDSCRGYEMCQEVVHESQYLKGEFQRRLAERQDLVNEFQAKIASYGGEVQENGSIPAAFHRGYTKFVSVFKDDKKTAIDAIDTGEDFLAEHIETQLGQDGLTTDSINLLRKAHASAISSENLVERLNN